MYQAKGTPGQLTPATFVKLSQVGPGNHGQNVYLRVEQVTKSEVVRFDGTKLQIAEGLAGDDTGVIKFRVVGEYAEVLQKGKVVAWRNGLSEVFQEHHRLGLDQFGRITVEDSTNVPSVNHEGKKYSDVAYEQVRTGDRRDNRGDDRRDNRGDRRDNRGDDRRDNRGNNNRDDRRGEDRRQNRDNRRDNRDGDHRRGEERQEKGGEQVQE